MVAYDRVIGVSMGYRIPVTRCGVRLAKRGLHEDLGDWTIWNDRSSCSSCLELAGVKLNHFVDAEDRDTCGVCHEGWPCLTFRAMNGQR